MKLMIIAVVIGAGVSAQSSPTPGRPRYEVKFSPDGGCTVQVASLIRGAKSSVRQAAYAYTSDAIADAAIAAKHAGVDVQLLIDKAWSRRPQVERLRRAGVPVWTDARHAIMHDKFVVIDDAVVETGSFNYTQAADHSNAENCLTINDPDLAKLYAANWASHKEHSRP
jgi:phosphatidylserine/phosphatidylglycerophosphate/cardiolipin synthase-like enzyme